MAKKLHFRAQQISMATQTAVYITKKQKKKHMCKSQSFKLSNSTTRKKSKCRLETNIERLTLNTRN
ncbi:unnamed protein product [Brassica napus]|uniref:(rape) hypothetical protein n=1 Tax=Brassica napus TaxID=3708 RepID=A0A817B621_BRANA|nr:unnamed protein product [Brassica napus]